MLDRLSEAMNSMPARDVEQILKMAEKRLRKCILCEADGAIAVRITWKDPSHQRGSLLLCPSCLERHRLPDSRSDVEG